MATSIITVPLDTWANMVALINDLAARLHDLEQDRSVDPPRPVPDIGDHQPPAQEQRMPDTSSSGSYSPSTMEQRFPDPPTQDRHMPDASPSRSYSPSTLERRFPDPTTQERQLPDAPATGGYQPSPPERSFRIPPIILPRPNISSLSHPIVVITAPPPPIPKYDGKFSLLIWNNILLPRKYRERDGWILLLHNSTAIRPNGGELKAELEEMVEFGLTINNI